MTRQHVLRRLGRRMRAAAAEAHYASSRAATLALAYDRLLPEPDSPPADYAEFLLRSSMLLLREPSAGERLRGGRCR